VNCRRCERLVHPRKRPDLPGIEMHGRGLCISCHNAAKADGTLEQYDCLPASGGRNGSRPTGHTVEDFGWYVDNYGGEREPTRLGWSRRTRRSAAARLGMSLVTLDRALYRHLDREAA
jgi:hypothetical protein